MLDAFSTGATDVATDGLDQLSPREREVMRLIARGYTYREVARDLVLSVKTVETHVSAVLRKLQLSNRHELAKWAAASHLVVAVLRPASRSHGCERWSRRCSQLGCVCWRLQVGGADLAPRVAAVLALRGPRFA